MDEFMQDFQNPSINGMVKIADGLINNPELDDAKEELGIDEDDFGVDNEILNILKTVRNVVIGYALFILLFVV